MRLVGILVAGALLLGAGPAAPAAKPAGQTAGSSAVAGGPQANKAVVRSYLEEILGAGRFDALDELVAADYTDSTPGADPAPPGPTAVRQARELMSGSFKDIHYTIDQLIAEGDLVVARYTVHAVHLPPAERAITITGITIFRLAGGRIRETWIINDQLEMLRQLGFKFEPPTGDDAAPANPAPAAPPAEQPPAAAPPPPGRR